MVQVIWLHVTDASDWLEKHHATSIYLLYSIPLSSYLCAAEPNLTEITCLFAYCVVIRHKSARVTPQELAAVICSRATMAEFVEMILAQVRRPALCRLLLHRTVSWIVY